MGRLEDIAAAQQATLDAVTALQTDVDAIQQTITDLRAQLAGGAGVTDADLAAIQTQAESIRDRLAAVKSDAETPV